MNKLTALIEAAKLAKKQQEIHPNHDYRLKLYPATILELCALLEKAEEALLSEDVQTMEGLRCAISIEALAAIKQWKEKADAIRGMEKST